MSLDFEKGFDPLPSRTVAIYARVSTEKQEAENQLVQMRKYCDDLMFNVHWEYVDIISGSEERRPAWDRLFIDAHIRQFNLVLFWSLDRFSRSGTLFTLQKLKELENLGIAWHSYTEQYFSSLGEFKDVVISILATLAKIEKQKISQRTKAGLENSPNKHLIGKRGPDKNPRRVRSDRGIKRSMQKNPLSYIKD